MPNLKMAILCFDILLIFYTKNDDMTIISKKITDKFQFEQNNLS